MLGVGVMRRKGDGVDGRRRCRRPRTPRGRRTLRKRSTDTFPSAESGSSRGWSRRRRNVTWKGSRGLRPRCARRVSVLCRGCSGRPKTPAQIPRRVFYQFPTDRRCWATHGTHPCRAGPACFAVHAPAPFNWLRSTARIKSLCKSHCGPKHQ